MNDLRFFDQLGDDCRAYSQSFPRLLESHQDQRLPWREKLFDVLLSSTRLYLDDLLLKRNFEQFHANSVDGLDQAKRTLDEETKARRALTRILKEFDVWKMFEPVNSFSDLTGLRTIADYNNNFVLHLPEIFGEALIIEKNAAIFLATKSNEALWRIHTGLEHMGRNHITFAIPALQWATEETSWSD